MMIYISTLGRYDIKKQLTLSFLSPEWKDCTSLVVVEEEYKKYRDLFGGEINIIVLPDNIVGLSANRQWLLENSKGKFVCFMDDDLTFDQREENSIKLKKCKKIDGLLEDWVDWLAEGYGIVGVSSRNGNNRVSESFETNSRIMSAYAFNREVLLKEKIRFDRVKAMQDFDVVLQLLKKGYRNKVSYKYAHGQGFGSGAEGGCSVYRTPELKKDAAFNLVKLHPDVVRIRSKINKTGWNGMEKKQGIDGVVSTDVTIEWKKAFKPNKKGIDHEKGMRRFL